MNTGYKGIDVSQHQGEINWAKVSADGVQFAMIRVGIGSRKNTSTPDARFSQNVEGALANGIEVGVYLYSYALDASAARQEAAFVLRQIEPYRGRLSYPIIYDIEDKTQADLGRSVLTDMCEAFCSAIQEAGWLAGIYANLDWVRNKLNVERLAPFHLWLAHWVTKTTYTGEICLWQYTDKGKVAGIAGNVDMNMGYRDYPALVRQVGLNGYASPEGAALPAEPPISPHPATVERKTIREGSAGEDVLYLALRMAEMGYLQSIGFGADLRQAVTAYQKDQGLTADGIVGPRTWAAIG